MKVLIVDDQRSARRAMSCMLRSLEGVERFEADSLDSARSVLAEHAIDLALIDLRLGSDPRNRDGLELVREITQTTTAFPVVVTGSSEMAEIRTAMRYGAYDYILKDDLCEEVLLPIVEGLRTRRRLEREVAHLRARCAASPGLQRLLGNSPAIERLRAIVQRVALSDRPVLVTGPTGSGKEVVVQAIHALGAHPDQPLLDLNCGAIPEHLIESQLFGHERGAFTGADRAQLGCFAAVRQGTLFLDEIAELPMQLQARLLRVIESGCFRPIGTTVEARFEGRLVAATHADLAERVRTGRFREDLYYRLNVLQVTVPSLEEHREDIPALVAHFAGKLERPLRFSQNAMEALVASVWPGNVRELRNVVDRLAVFADEDLITAEVLGRFTEQAVTQQGESVRDLARSLLRIPTMNKLEAIESALIAEAMMLAGGNKSAAARLLGVHRKALDRRLDKHADRESGDNESELEASTPN